MTTGLIETIDHGDIREIRLARAPVNALNTELCRALIDALNAALDHGARGIVLAGNPKIFSAGMDVPYLLSLGDNRNALLDAWQAFFGAARTLAESRVPVVAAHRARTRRRLRAGAVLRLPGDGPQRGSSAPVRTRAQRNPGGPGGAGRHPAADAPRGRFLPRGAAAGRGRNGAGRGALEIGLVDELVDQDNVTARSIAWLQQLLRLPHQPMLQTRTLARRDLVEALDPSLIQLERFVDAWHAPDTQAALQALVEKLKK